MASIFKVVFNQRLLLKSLIICSYTKTISINVDMTSHCQQHTRIQVTPAKRGKGKKIKPLDETQDQTPAEKRASMTWAQRLKRVFNIDIETCSECGGEVRIIASIEDPAVINKILAHLNEKAATVATARLPECRAPPATGPPVGLLV